MTSSPPTSRIAAMIKGNQRRRLVADVALHARLRAGGFQGPDWELFAKELVGYGVDTIGGWVRSGRIYKECRNRGVRGLPGENRRRLSPQDIADLTELTVAEAICAYRAVLCRGGWSPERGTSLTTFFIGQCLLQFPSAYRRWQKETRPAHWVYLDCDDGSPVDIEDPTDVIEAAIGRLDDASHLRGLDDRTRRVVTLRMDGYTEREIGEQLAMTPRAVEGVLYRYRRQLRLSRGEGTDAPARVD
jgi:DNA-directed RNA polymerase specialized sigma24 family protein